jgi:predicted outer membrane repeat protein
MEKWKITTGSVTIDRMAFVDNAAATLGGAVGINDQSTTGNDRGTVTITNSTFEDNSANCPNYGGGGAVYVGSCYSITVQNSTFSGNTANNVLSWRAYGGALFMNAGGMTAPVGLVQNSTFVDNSMTGASTSGGAIYGSDNVTVESCVFAGNSVRGGTAGIVDLTKGLAGTIINSIGEGDIINAGTLDGGGNTENLGAGNALVDVLADNGGPTLTHALLTGSPAIDAGSNPAGLTYDQRGAGYARVVGSRADMGAYEIPEPATMAVLGLGSLAVLCRRRRR